MNGEPPKQKIPYNKRGRYSIGHCRDDFRSIYRVPVWSWKYGNRIALASIPGSPFLDEQQIMGVVSRGHDLKQLIKGKIRCFLHFFWQV